MRIRLLRGWQGSPAGSVHDWGRGVAELLILRRIAEEVVEESEKALHGPPADKAIHQAPVDKASTKRRRW